MEKMERKKIILLNLISAWKKLCRKSLKKLQGQKNTYSYGFISGELKTIEIMRKFIEEAWRK